MIKTKIHFIIIVTIFSLIVSDNVQAMCPEPDVAGTAALPSSCGYRNDQALQSFLIIVELTPGPSLK